MLALIKQLASHSYLRVFVGILALITLAATPNLSARAQADYDLVIKNIRTVDAINGEQASQWIGITNGTISYVSGEPLPASYAMLEIDGSGKTLIPGLWDAHVHYTFDQEIQGSMHRLFIANGITSVRDTGGLLELLLPFLQQTEGELAPDVYFAGPLIDGEPTVYDGALEGFPKIAKTAATPEQARAMVRELAQQGVHLVKAYEMLSETSFRAVVDEATKLGLPVTGHVPLGMTANAVIETGIASLEHLRNLQMACSEQNTELFAERRRILAEEQESAGSVLRRKLHDAQHFSAVSSYSAENCQELITAMAKHQTVQVPTLALNGWMSAPYYAEPDWQATYKTLPADVADKWLQGSKLFANRFAKPSESQQNQISISDWQLQFTRDLIEAGVPFMAGTDTPIFYLTPGFSLHLELQTLVAAGLSPIQALEAATLTPARFFGLEAELGSIQVGMRADLLLLNKNPLEDIAHTKSIHAVIKGGKLLDRTALNKLLSP